MKKNVPLLVKQNVMKIEVFILGIDQKRKKEWGRRRRERIEKGSRERIEIECNWRVQQARHPFYSPCGER